MWRAIANWVIAGCLSATALNFSADYNSPTSLSERTVQEENRQETLGDLVTQQPTSSVQQVANLQLQTVQTPKETVVSSPNGMKAEETSKEPVKIESDKEDSLETAEYKVQPEDVLQITVYEEPDLSTKARVTGKGEINVPLLGRIHVSGLSVLEVQEKIEKLLGEDYLVNPQVQVFIISYHARSVFITGAVNRPGSYALPLGRPTTIMEAISMAGGFTQEAAPNSTRIVRIENGKETAIQVKANDVIKKGDKTKDIQVQPNDVIFIPESFF